jgi:hypothetical protein
MKQLFKYGYIAAALSLLWMSLAIPAPARAAVQQCKPVNLPGGNSSYPGIDGHLFNCMPEPRNQLEKDMQIVVVHDVIASVGKYGPKNEDILGKGAVDIMVFYNGQDAFDTLGIETGAREPSIKPNESGRSWATVLGQPSLKTPTTTVWIWTQTQWTALKGKIPSMADVDANQLMGTTKHELGHQFDVQWAKVSDPSWTSITMNDSIWRKALSCDAKIVTNATRESAMRKWPRLFTGVGDYAQNEIFAELCATEVSGGVDPIEDLWLKMNLSCAYYYVQTLEQSNGAGPATRLPNTLCRCSDPDGSTLTLK